MTNKQLAKYKAALELKLAELSQAIRDRNDIAIENAPDPLDKVQIASERELEISKIDRETQLRSNVRAALRRMEEGCFGECLHCGESIRPRRLDAVPWAPLCITCQSLAEDGATPPPQEAFA